MNVKLWRDYSPRWWALGFEVYRQPVMYSQARGAEYGSYLYVGPWRFHVVARPPFRAAR